MPITLKFLKRVVGWSMEALDRMKDEVTVRAMREHDRLAREPKREEVFEAIVREREDA